MLEALYRVRVLAEKEIGADEQTAGAKQALERVQVLFELDRLAVVEHQVIAGIQRRKDVTAGTNVDSHIGVLSREELTREPGVLGVLLDRVDMRACGREPERAVAESGAELEHAPGGGRRCEHAQERAAPGRVDRAAVDLAVPHRLAADVVVAVAYVLVDPRGHGGGRRRLALGNGQRSPPRS